LASGGSHYKRWSLLELSYVSVPCNANALVIQRTQLSPREQALLRFRQLQAEMASEDPAVLRSRAKRLLHELKEAGQW